MTDAADQSKLIAHSIIAQGRLDRLRSYLDRGRQYEALSLNNLAQTSLVGARGWGADPFAPKPEMDEASMEYELRGLRPPYDLGKDDIERGIATVGAQAARMSDTERRDANARMVADHQRSIRSEN